YALESAALILSSLASIRSRGVQRARCSRSEARKGGSAAARAESLGDPSTRCSMARTYARISAGSDLWLPAPSMLGACVEAARGAYVGSDIGVKRTSISFLPCFFCVSRTSRLLAIGFGQLRVE